MSNNIPPIQNTNNIRIADFIRLTTQDANGDEQIYRFATTPSVLTIPEVDAEPFNALGSLVKVGDVQRDIKSTANETTVTLVGIETAQLGLDKLPKAIETEPRQWTVNDWPDLTQMDVFKKNKK